ncbi:5'-nucleotidase C-terminal domain-containing protein (plasmid) [Streptomyces sp. NBC_01426]|uniref:bifunctional metallophosphatase/5'-nucleotidase n=1 Tax=Streptomyces sp. NBC_01426 TaxID=2975866 RepID=UPI002E32F82C|nr:5'-nucleotidase C-terminal domain-containing protein [Streptomyces sp. NBC_01426]
MSLPKTVKSWNDVGAGRRSFLTAMGAVGATVATGVPAYASDHARDVRDADGHVDVQLLNITDLHGYLAAAPGGDSTIHGNGGQTYTVGGVAYMAAHLKRIRDGKANSLFFSPGDNFSGWEFDAAVFADEPTIEAFNLMKLDFSTAGNHEFDKSPAMITQHMEEGVPFPVVGQDTSFIDSAGRRFPGADFLFYSGNVQWRGDGADVLPAYNIRYVDGPSGEKIPVGFIHLTAIGTESSSTAYLPAVKTRDELQTVNRLAALLKKRGVNAIVLSMHDGAVAGGDFNGGLNPSGPAYELALQASPDIDVIVTGHWHTRFNMMLPDPNGVPRPFVEAGCHGQLINEINLKLDPRTGKVVRELTVSTNHPNTRTGIAPDPEMRQVVSYWNGQATTRANSTIGRQRGSFLRARNAAGESTMGDLVADWALWAGSRPTNKNFNGNCHPNIAAQLAMVALAPRVGQTVIAGDLVHDPATNGAIPFVRAWRGVGYGDPVVSVWVTGQQIHDALEQQWTTKEGGGIQYAPFAVSKNVRYSFNSAAGVGNRVDPRNVHIDGKALEPTRRYRLATLAYTLVGADGYPALTDFEEPFTHQRDFESFVAFVRQAGTLVPAPTNRVSVLSSSGALRSELGEIVDPVEPRLSDGTPMSRPQAAIVTAARSHDIPYPPC